MSATTQNILLFIVLPYVAAAVFLVGTIVRLRKAPYSFSSLSSQFLESDRHFWGLTAFHYGIIVALVGHLVGLLTPVNTHFWNATPLRMHTVGLIALTSGLVTLLGISVIIHRRLLVPMVRAVTTPADVLVLALIAFQVISGIYVSLTRPWAVAWFEALVGPYVRSMVLLKPDMSYVSAMPVAVKIHMVNACIIIAVFPFTRLVHMLVAPIPYAWRKVQVARWVKPKPKPSGAVQPANSVTQVARAAAGGK
jgi:nitrate reductase gamma subunit